MKTSRKLSYIGLSILAIGFTVAFLSLDLNAETRSKYRDLISGTVNSSIFLGCGFYAAGLSLANKKEKKKKVKPLGGGLNATPGLPEACPEDEDR